MINALYNLGKYVVEKEQKERIDIFPDEMKLNRSKKILFVTLEKVEGDFRYVSVIEEQFDKSNNLKVKRLLYKGGPPAGVNFSPTSLVTKSPETTFESRVIKWFKKYDDNEIFSKIYAELEENKGIISHELKEKYSNMPNEDKTNLILSISIKEDSEYKYVGDYEIFQDILLEETVKRYYHLSTLGQSKGLGECYLCGSTKEVYGFVPNAFGFSFSNADKKGNIPNFVQIDQWKQVPICEDCGVFLEAGKKFVEKYLSFSNFSIRYYVIPNFLFKGNLDEYDEFYDAVKDYVRPRYQDKYGRKKYEDTLIEQESSDDDSLYSVVNGMDDIIEFKFLFYETKSGGKYTDILNYVESVLPSWVMTIHDAQLRVMGDILFQEYNLKLIFGNVSGNFVKLRISQSKKEIKEHNWYGSFIRDFFPFKTDNKYFLDIIGSVVGDKQLNKDFLLSFFMKRIRKTHRQNPENDYFVKIYAIESLMILMFLNELNLIKGVNKMNIGTKNEQLNQNDFFEIYGEFIDTADKKASFLMGVLTKKLTAVQYRSLGATPFMTKLWGLSLDQKKLEKLYPMIISKLREYKLAYKDLEELTSLNLLESSKNWNLTRDETSFYFTLGLTMSNIITNKKEEKGDLNE